MSATEAPSFWACFTLEFMKSSTAGSKIRWIGGKERLSGEILYRVIQAFGKGLNKGAAAGGAGLIELYAVHRPVLDPYTFHILSADIQDTVYFRVKKAAA